MADLLGRTSQHHAPQLLQRHILAFDAAISVRCSEGLLDHGTHREHRQQGDHVGEPLVQRGLVREARFEETAPQPVQDGVGGLMDDDVVAQAGVHRRTPLDSGDVPEQQGAVLEGVVGVSLCERMRHQMQMMPGEAPRESPAQRGLKRRQRARATAYTCRAWKAKSPTSSSSGAST